MRRFHSLIDEARGLAGEEDEVQQRLAAWDDAHRLLLTAFEGILADLDAQSGVASGGQSRSR
jgi:hypothetical protein